MQDDPVVNNKDERTVNKVKMAGLIFVPALIMCVWLGFAPEKGTSNVPDQKIEPLAPESTGLVLKAAAPVVPAETKKEYLASTRKIGRKGSAIFYKEYLKSPTKFNGERLNVRGQIMAIEESDGQTVIQLQITEKLDTVIAYYPGSVKVYQDDWITIYGEGKGTYDGSNRMGASMTWPVMLAKYIMKDASME